MRAYARPGRNPHLASPGHKVCDYRKHEGRERDSRVTLRHKTRHVASQSLSRSSRIPIKNYQREWERLGETYF